MTNSNEQSPLLASCRDNVVADGPSHIPANLAEPWHSQLRQMLEATQSELFWQESDFAAQKRRIEQHYLPLHTRHHLDSANRAAMAQYATNLLLGSVHPDAYQMPAHTQRRDEDGQDYFEFAYHGTAITVTTPADSVVRVQAGDDDFHLTAEMFTSTSSVEQMVMPLVEASLDASYARLSVEQESLDAERSKRLEKAYNVRAGLRRLEQGTADQSTQNATLAAAFPALPDPSIRSTTTTPPGRSRPTPTTTPPTHARRLKRR